MKYTISQLRLHEFMRNYLDSFVEGKDVSYPNPYIIISEPNQDDDDSSWVDYMEYDYTDGRLWINKSFMGSLMDTFAMDKETVEGFLSEWFSNKFEVDIKFVE